MTSSGVTATKKAGGAAALAGASGPAPRHESLTRLRLVLIGWVVLYHLDLPLRVTGILPWLWPVLGVGYLGVDGFFLLSGFALWLGYGSRPPVDFAGVRRFLVRRLAKIWPLHAAALLALAAVVGLAQAGGASINDPERFSGRDFLLQLFLVNAWETTTRFSWNYPSWALSVEWAGYLALPAALLLLLRLPAAAVPALAAAAVAGLFWLDARAPEVGLNYTYHLGLVRFAFEFSLGLALGRLATEDRLPGAAVLAATLAVPFGLGLQRDALTVAGLAAVIVALWQRPSRGHGGAAARPDLLLRLGEASFGVYLCWVFIETALVGVLRVADPGPAGRVLLMAGGFVANLAAGWLAWRLVEVPAHRWIMARAEPRRTALDPAHPAAR
ncbi:MAG: acyltransferase [Acetobacteraceae bacterium]|nr:acyltransferase [Acetobacteraceae bacterium]